MGGGANANVGFGDSKEYHYRPYIGSSSSTSLCGGTGGQLPFAERRRRSSTLLPECDMTSSVQPIDVKKNGRLFRPASIGDDSAVDAGHLPTKASTRCVNGSGRISSAELLMQSKFAPAVENGNGVGSPTSSTPAAVRPTLTDGLELAAGDVGSAVGAKTARCGLPSPHSVGEFLLEAFSSGAPRLSGRG